MTPPKELETMDIGLLQMQILWLLGHKPTHGYELMKKLDKIKKTKIGSGTLYPTLKKLLDLGLVEAKENTIHKRKVYSLTKKGKVLMIAKCEEFCRVFEDIFDHFSCKKCIETTEGIVFKTRSKKSDIYPVCGKKI